MAKKNYKDIFKIIFEGLLVITVSLGVLELIKPGIVSGVIDFVALFVTLAFVGVISLLLPNR